MSPVPILGSEYTMDADVVISAIGQKVDQLCLGEMATMGWTRRGTIDVNSVTMQTAIDGVFAAGDAVTGPATVIEGHRRRQTGPPKPSIATCSASPNPKCRRYRCAEAGKHISKFPPAPKPLSSGRSWICWVWTVAGRRSNRWSWAIRKNMAREEARRCLRCDICRRCGRCIEVCRDKMGISALQMGLHGF